MNKNSIAGITLFIGVFEFTMFMIISEALRPTYSVSTNYISDLGVGANSYIFNYSIMGLGAFTVVTALIILSIRKNTILPYTILLIGIGAFGVGLFNENSPYGLHTIFSLITFLFSGISAVVAVTWARGPYRYISLAIGLIILVAVGLYATSHYLGLGAGGMERMIVYPTLLWGMAFSGYLMGLNRKSP
ncbi:MAG: DUF998 domain-containing protein [Candidatus Thermoplasmatota archaeon]|jgi:hypothetical membrane protein|nr:DUF998 domain-containing protein [Candidatus Thermoplasmatota archaeon]